jgi:hypothetical protein
MPVLFLETMLQQNWRAVGCQSSFVNFLTDLVNWLLVYPYSQRVLAASAPCAIKADDFRVLRAVESKFIVLTKWSTFVYISMQFSRCTSLLWTTRPQSSNLSMPRSRSAKRPRLDDTLGSKNYSVEEGAAKSPDEQPDDSEDCCTICLQPISDRTVIPTCSHEFCFECLLLWTGLYSI